MFYNEYERFYKMTAQSEAFAAYCKEAFGEDLSQDGFSDMDQIELIMSCFPKRDNISILDVGCGNGKLLKYLHEKLNCRIYGFDYSENAIRTAVSINNKAADFRVGTIGDIDYPSETFDVILSMDSIYFAKDMVSFIRQAKRWLRPEGIFIVAYQEGDVMPKTENAETTAIAQAFRENNIDCRIMDITADTYELMLKKRAAMLRYKDKFKAEGISEWFDMVLGQTSCADVPFEEYRKNNARYIYFSLK